MKRSISSLPFFLLLSLVFLAPLIHCDDLIDNTCKKTPDYDLCVSSLKSKSESSDADVQRLAIIMANITLSNASDILNYIQVLINHTTEPKLEQSLSYCAEVYIQVVDYILPQAIEALSRGQPGFANYGISDAAKEVNRCKSVFPLADRNKLVENLSGVTLAIVNILLKG